MRNKIIIALLFICQGFSASSQEPVQWNFSTKRIDEKTFEMHLTGTITSPWHIYSQFTPTGGPVATQISFSNNPIIAMIDKVREIGSLEQHHEPLFGVDVKQFSGIVDFVQVVQLKANVKTSVTGTIKYMTCNDKECLPPKTIPFTIIIK